MTKIPAIKLHHGALAVSNIERSLDFYQRVLGFEFDTEIDLPDSSLKIVHINRGDDYLELFCHEAATELPEHSRDNMTDFQVVGTKHIAFTTDEPELVHQHLNEQGVNDLTEIFDNNPYYKYFFFRDPDGIALEVVSPLPREC